MRRKYGDCVRDDGDCTQCSMVNYGRDCHNKHITKLEWYRRMRGLSQQQLSGITGINYRQIQRIELGISAMANVTLANAIALADALDVDPRDLM